MTKTNQDFPGVDVQRQNVGIWDSGLGIRSGTMDLEGHESSVTELPPSP
jgi:hypothetical protein